MDALADLFWRFILNLFFIWPAKAVYYGIKGIASLFRRAPAPASEPWSSAPIAQPQSRPARLPTPQESAQAVGLMQVAHSRIDDYFADYQKYADLRSPYHLPDPPLSALEKGTQSLLRAQQLDASAKLKITDKDGTLTYTPDTLAALLCFHEARAYEQHAQSISEQGDLDAQSLRDAHFDTLSKAKYGNFAAHNRHFKGEIQAKDAKAQKHAADQRSKAARAIEKALVFEPASLLCLLTAPRLLAAAGFPERAKLHARSAVQHYPSNIECMKMAQDYGVF